MKYSILLFLAIPIIAIAEENLPSNLSREPNCIPDTYCMKPGDTYIPSTVPIGFSRKPDCVTDTICVDEHVYMLEKDFLILKDVIDSEIVSHREVKIYLSEIMSGIMLVNVHRPHYFSQRILLEANGDTWEVLREQTAVH